MKGWRFLLLVFTVLLFSVVQFLNIGIFGVKPNLPLIAVIVAIFFVKNFKEELLLIVLGALALKFSPGLSKEIWIFIILGLVAYFSARFLPWNYFINCFILMFLTTTIFYIAVGGINFLMSLIYVKEIVYNLVIAGGLFYFYKLLGLESADVFKKL